MDLGRSVLEHQDESEAGRPGVLLIDDDDSVRTTLRLTLEHFGHTVIEARNGTEGLELFQQAAADLVITDIVMPEKEGFEVLRELRRMQPPVKIIAISGAGRDRGAGYLQTAKVHGCGEGARKAVFYRRAADLRSRFTPQKVSNPVGATILLSSTVYRFVFEDVAEPDSNTKQSSS